MHQMKQNGCTLRGRVSHAIQHVRGVQEDVPAYVSVGPKVTPFFRKSINKLSTSLSIKPIGSCILQACPPAQLSSSTPNSRQDRNGTSRCAHSDCHEHQVRLLSRGSSTVGWGCALFSMGEPTVALRIVRKSLAATD